MLILNWKRNSILNIFSVLLFINAEFSWRKSAHSHLWISPTTRRCHDFSALCSWLSGNCWAACGKFHSSCMYHGRQNCTPRPTSLLKVGCKWFPWRLEGWVVQNWVLTEGLCLNLNSDLNALKANSVWFICSTIWWLDALKRITKISEKKLLNKWKRNRD